jgi:hypothetical protein
MADRLLAILASGLAVLSVSPPLFIEETKLGLVRPPVPLPPFSLSDGKLRSISDIGEVTMGTLLLPTSLESSMSISPVDGISMMEGLVSFRLKLFVSCFKLLLAAEEAPAAAVRFALADTERLKEEVLRDSVREVVTIWVAELDWRFFISERLFFSSPRVDFTSGVDSAARLWPVKALK